MQINGDDSMDNVFAAIVAAVDAVQRHKQLPLAA